MHPLRTLLTGLGAAFADARVQGLLAFTFTLVGCAALFYSWAEGWSLLDATYFSVMTLSTVGYGDFSPQTTVGKLFTIAYVLIGLGVFVAAASSIADVLLRQSNRDR